MARLTRLSDDEQLAIKELFYDIADMFPLEETNYNLTLQGRNYTESIKHNGIHFYFPLINNAVELEFHCYTNARNSHYKTWVEFKELITKQLRSRVSDFLGYKVIIRQTTPRVVTGMFRIGIKFYSI